MEYSSGLLTHLRWVQKQVERGEMSSAYTCLRNFDEVRLHAEGFSTTDIKELDVLNRLLSNLTYLPSCAAGIPELLRKAHDVLCRPMKGENNNEQAPMASSAEIKSLMLTIYLQDVSRMKEYLCKYVFDAKVAQSAFIEACKRGNVDLVKALCEHFKFTKKDIQADDCIGLTWAAHNGSCDLVNYLKNEFALDYRDICGNDNLTLSMSAARGNIETLKILVKGMSNVHITGNDNIVLNVACKCGSCDVVAFLLQEYVYSPNHILKALEIAQKNCNLNVVILLKSFVDKQL